MLSEKWRSSLKMVINTIIKKEMLRMYSNFETMLWDYSYLLNHGKLFKEIINKSHSPQGDTKYRLSRVECKTSGNIIILFFPKPRKFLGKRKWLFIEYLFDEGANNLFLPENLRHPWNQCIISLIADRCSPYIQFYWNFVSFTGECRSVK